MLDRFSPHLESPYQLSLEVLYALYLQTFERIDPGGANFTTEELNPSPEEIQHRIDLTIKGTSINSERVAK